MLEFASDLGVIGPEGQVTGLGLGEAGRGRDPRALHAVPLPLGGAGPLGRPGSLLDTGSLGAAGQVKAGPPGAAGKKKRAAEGPARLDFSPSPASQGTDVTETPGGTKKKKRGGSKRESEQGGKGLKHFSMKVCAKVEQKQATSYNEVADELVQEFLQGEGEEIVSGGMKFDNEKNIRRRVYDALNVLQAAGIISKDKKDITWRGLPTTVDIELDRVQEERRRVEAHLEKKQLYLQELKDQYHALESLLARNQKAGQPGDGLDRGEELQLPFLVVQARPEADIEVFPSEDNNMVVMDFNTQPFTIHDEQFVLQNMVSEGALAAVPQRAAKGKGKGKRK